MVAANLFLLLHFFDCLTYEANLCAEFSACNISRCMKPVFTKASRFEDGVGGGGRGTGPRPSSLTTLTLSARMETERVEISVAALLIIRA